MSSNDPFATYITHWRDFLHRCLPAGRTESISIPGTGEAEFNRLALELFGLQFHHHAVYRHFCAARGATPTTATRWAAIPAVPASAFKEFDLTSLPPGRRTAVFHSSGTTGHRPGCHYHDAESLRVYAESLAPWFRVHLLPEADAKAAAGFEAPGASPEPAGSSGPGQHPRGRMVILSPAPVQAPHSSLVYMFETVRRIFADGESVYAGRLDMDGGWSLDVAGVTKALQQAMDGQTPVLLMGTAFCFVHLLDHLLGQGQSYALPGGSRVLETGGYKGRSRSLPKAELHGLIGRHLGVAPANIICEYGMCELSSQAYDWAAGVPGTASKVAGIGSGVAQGGRVFQFPPWARAVVVSPEDGREVADGETGLLRVWDLANVRSVMAVQTEDLALRRGAGFEWVGRAAQSAPRGCSLMPAAPR